VRSPLRIAIDATSLLDTRTGVGNFTDALVRGLAVRDDVAVTAFPVSLRGRGRLREVVPPGVRVVSPPLPAVLAREAWRRFDRPRIDLAIGLHDVVHGPNFVVPPSRAARVVTVHDLTPIRFPELCNRATLVYPQLIRRAVDGGAWVHADSEAVRTELLDELRLDPDRVVTVPLGFTPMAGGDAGRGRALAGTDDFVLAVGTVEPRKDLPSLVRAIDALAGQGTDLPLVHVGPPGWGTEALDREVARMGRPDLVQRLGRLPDADLRDLYEAARLFAYPSVYEGFGLPVLEAMSAGVPVVATSVPAVAEVAGDAAVLVPPGDVSALADALETLWDDEDRRRELVAAGLERARGYSWEACLEGMVGLYRRALADVGRR
jgi:glycosyltransferase involved in cell wall biosynthesis